MLVGTNDGKILKIVMTYNGTNHIPLIAEQLSVSMNIYYYSGTFCNHKLDKSILKTTCAKLQISVAFEILCYGIL